MATQTQQKDSPFVATDSLPGRVLVADDESLVATHICDTLKELGMEVIGPVSNGIQAVEMAREQKPEMALLDIRMPLLDGLEAAQIIYGVLGIPVIIVSAYADREYIDTGSEVGIFGYVIKPVKADSLRASITVAWSRCQDRHGLQNRIRELEQMLQDRKIIERAKGMLMDSMHLGEAQAMRLLQKHARDNRIRIVDLAQNIIDGTVSLSPRRA